jgi:hypothetical protein
MNDRLLLAVLLVNLLILAVLVVPPGVAWGRRWRAAREAGVLCAVTRIDKDEYHSVCADHPRLDQRTEPIPPGALIRSTTHWVSPKG